MCQDEKRFYAVYSEASEQIRLERELTDANEKMQDIINAIPGGVAIYKVSDIFETVYFSDGVPELSGYTTEEYRQMIQTDAAEMTYWEEDVYKRQVPEACKESSNWKKTGNSQSEHWKPFRRNRCV